MFCKEESSFRNEMSTTDKISHMVNDNQSSFLKKEKLTGVFIDLKKRLTASFCSVSLSDTG